jgi:polyphenol oxidase
MGVLATAAQDPIFFAHHSNIDRLWDIWLSIPGVQGNPTDQAWLNNGWSFYDENKQWVTITVQQVINLEKNLGYKYQPPQVPGYTTTSAICTAEAMGQAPLGFAAAPAPQSQTLSVVSDAKGIAVGTKPHTRKVALPPALRTGIQRLAAGTRDKEYVLHIDGVDLPADAATIVRVFIGLPDATPKTQPDDKHFVGYITLVPAGPAHHHSTLRNVSFELTPALAATAIAQSELSVTLVPVTVADTEPASNRMTYKRIYLTEN